MNKIKHIIISLLLLMMPIIHVNAGVCDPIIDKNGYCDKEGIYKDPTFQEIKDNNCSGYTKKISDYCSVTCREEAKTIFPTKVPFVAVDRYNAILGGSHFKWEEIKTKAKRECKMTFNYNDYLIALKQYGIVPYDGSSSSNNGGFIGEYNISGNMAHLLRESHQRYTDVKVCDLLNNRITTANGYNQLTVNYYNANGGAAKKRAQAAAYSAGYNLNNCGGCKTTEETTSVPGNLIKIGELKGDSTENATCSSLENRYIRDFKEKMSAYGISYSDSQISQFITVVPQQSTGTAINCVAYTCAYSDYKEAGKPNKDGANNVACPGLTVKKPVYKGNARVYHAVRGENLINFTGLVETGYAAYCDYDNLPYNSEGWDVLEYSSSSTSSTGTGNHHYITSTNKRQNNLINLIKEVSKCEAAMSETPNVEKDTSITVNYSDNPSKIYQIKNGLKLNKKTVSTNTDKKEKVKYSTFYYSDCNDMTESQIKQKFIASLNSGKLLTNICSTKKKTIKVYETINSTSEATYKYEMPSNTYRYVLKTTGEAIHSPKKNKGDVLQTENMIKAFAKVKDNYQYIDVGYPNYAVHYTTPTGTYPISLTYTNIGIDGHFIKEADYLCEYKVINRIINCPEGECPPEDDDDDDDDNGGGDKDCVTVNGYRFCYPKTPLRPRGLNVIYRPISLSQPFPGENGKNRVSGENWTADDIKRYITNNRKVSENSVYNKTPLYSFTLDARAIRNIRKYNGGKIALKNYTVNQNEGYSDFNLKCSEKQPGKRCISNFIKNITTLGVKVNSSTCRNSNDFYGCADKPNQDNVKCGLTKDKKLECLNCGLTENKNKTLCKEGDK